jgi:hypothetical protein
MPFSVIRNDASDSETPTEPLAGTLWPMPVPTEYTSEEAKKAHV